MSEDVGLNKAVVKSGLARDSGLALHFIKTGCVSVNGVVVRDGDYLISPGEFPVELRMKTHYVDIEVTLALCFFSPDLLE